MRCSSTTVTRFSLLFRIVNSRRSSVRKRYAALAGALVASTAIAVPMAPQVASALPMASSATKAKLLVPATQKVAGGAPEIDWPGAGRARLEVAGLGTIGQKYGSNTQVPIASVTKVMTAYTILKNHPLAAGAAGPTVEITRKDVATYNQLKADGASVLKVKEGVDLTQRQLLQGLLMESGSNLAVTLARWDSGTQAKFVAKMNKNAKALGMTNTTFVDVHGVSKKSSSSTEDLLDLAPAAMKSAAFRKIVGSKTAKIPLHSLKNSNKLLGADKVIGIKTGTTTPAGACLLFAATDTVNGKTYTVYGVLLGVKGNSAAKAKRFPYAKAMVKTARAELRSVALLKKGRALATVTMADGSVRKYGVKKTLTGPAWDGLAYKLSLPSGLAEGEAPTKIIVKQGSRTYSAALARLS
jgi:serine-type D-Ala-D-Ala carboxypeptidase (penicillin-binding protein 5/6)